MIVCVGVCAGASAPSLGAAGSYAVLAGSTVTNTGPTSANGDVGVSPGTSITGFPPGIVTSGSLRSADLPTNQAQLDLTTAYNAVAGQLTDQVLTSDLGGLVLLPGVYTFPSSAQLTGTLILDGNGDANAVFVFQIGSQLNTATSSVVQLINGASSAKVFWQVGSSATLGTSSAFAGDILALTSISLSTDATTSGRLLARNGAVTLASNVVFPTASGVTNDPHFHGLRGQSFLVNGVSGRVWVCGCLCVF